MSDKDVRKIVYDIKSVKIQGARNVAVAGARILGIVARESKAKDSRAFIKDLGAASKMVLSLRPTEPALRYGQELIMSKANGFAGGSVDDLRAHTVRACRNYIRETEKSLAKIATYGARVIEDGDVVMTHCHSHCVMEILKLAKRQGREFSVVVTETRPLLQGMISAKELSLAGIDVVYCIDSASAAMMRKTTKVLVGADAISAEGDVVNKIGTFQMAIVAKEFNVPFIVACGTHKYDSRTALGFPEPIEERSGDEVVGLKRLRDVKIVNPAFDATPKEYIREIITEVGVYSPETLVGLLVVRKKG